MAANPPISDDPCNTETDEETIALKKKRSRRVSFADREITSVHIFNRDEEYETPPDSSPSERKNPKPNSDNVSQVKNEVLGFFRDLSDSDDYREMSPSGDEDDDDDDDVDARKSFLRPIESPSPGSSVVGSATSNDEDNFFGPVSGSFIRRQLSDSAASDDNHDVTMDSTAFSMHYRSLVRLDSGGGNTIEEKTPSHMTTPSDSGRFMVLTKAKKVVSLPVEKVSGGKDSNDMTLVGETQNYDYGKLPPALEALLSEGKEDMQDVAFLDSNDKNSLKSSEISMFDEKWSGHHVDQKGCTDGESSGCMKLDEVDGVRLASIVHQTANGCSSHGNEDLAADVSVDQQMQTPNQLSKLQVDNDSSKTVLGMNMLNLGFPAVNDGASQSMDGKIPQLNVSAQHESGQIVNESCTGATPNNRRDANIISQHSDQQRRSPLMGSISSLSAKQRQIFSDAAKSCRQLSFVTPSPKQLGYFFGKENVRSGDNNLLDHKSNLKFKIFEPSPLSCSLKDGIENSKFRLSKLLSSTNSPSNAVAEENCKDIEGKNVDGLGTNLEKHLSSVDMGNSYSVRTDCMDSAHIEYPKSDGGSGKNVGTISPAEDGESLIAMSAHILSKEGMIQPMMEVASPSQFTWLQNKVEQHGLVPEKSKQQIVVVFGSDSLSDEIKLNESNNDKRNSPIGPSGSPAKTLAQKLSSAIENQGSLSCALPYDGFVNMGLGQDKTSVGKVTSNSHSMEVTDESENMFAEGRAQSSSSLVEANNFRDINQVEKVLDKQSQSSDLQHISEPLLLGTPLRERNTLKFPSRSPDQNIPFATNPIYSEKLPGEGNETSAPASASFYIHRRNMNEPPMLKRPFMKEMTQSPIKKELIQGPSHEELCNVSNDENVQSLARRIIPSSSSNGPSDNDSHLESQVLQSQISAQYAENSYLRKRRIEESVPQDADHANKIRKINESPNIQKSKGSDLEYAFAYASESESERNMTRSDTTMKHWADILLKFSAETQQVVPPLIDKLNIRSIGVLEDILVHVQKIKIYEMFCSQILSQKMCDQPSEIRQKRVAETKMLLYKLAYEKARQQLISVKHEQLLKSTQQLNSAIHKSQMLKSNQRNLFLPSNRDTTVHDNLRNPCQVNLGSEHEGSREKVATMKHELEALDRTTKNLIKNFYSFFKMKGEPSCSETIALLNDHLKKKTTWQFICEDLQLWKVDNFGSRNGKQKIFLNYQGLLFQRFAINDGAIPSIFVSNILNDVIITKHFPNMDAWMVFAFVLNTKHTKKHVGLKSFAQETQTTCSLLHNLLDVVGEVQLAQVEIRNLVQTSFRSSSVDQLDLWLCFIDFTNGRKVMVTLDMTCLNSGIYPSDIVPYQLQASVAGTCISVPESLSAKIKAAVNGVGFGYSRIIRLCRCISQLLLFSST